MLIKREKIPIKKIIKVGILPSFIKKLFYRIKGYKIGKDVSLGFGSVIIGQKVEIGDGTKIGFLTVIRAKHIKIGRFVKIGSMTMVDTERFEIDDDSRINEQVYVSGLSLPESELRVGKRCLIMQYSFLNPTKPIILEDDVALGGLCCIFTHSSWQSIMEGYPVRFEPVIIRKNVWIAWRVFVLPGIEIGENSTIGADSTVTMNIPENSLASGSPAKIHLTGEKYWPRKISDNAKLKILDEINQEFVAYLKDSGFEAELSKTDGNSKIQIKSFHGKIYFIESNKPETEQDKNNTIVSLFNDLPRSGMCMKLSISNKQRMGTNKLGEEYVRFLSRYGIRFERKD